MEEPPVGEVEAEVGPGAGAGGQLLAVVHPLDQPGRPQDVVGHPLSPLAPGLRVSEDVVEPLGGGQEPALLVGGVSQALGEALVLGGAVLLEFGHQPPDAGQLLVDPSDQRLPLGVEDVTLAGELGVAGPDLGPAGLEMGLEGLPGHPHHLFHQRVGIDRRHRATTPPPGQAESGRRTEGAHQGKTENDGDDVHARHGKGRV